MLKKFHQWTQALVNLPRLSKIVFVNLLLSPKFLLRVIKKNGWTPSAIWQMSGLLTVESLREAGPVFIKLGQILASRNDLLPSEICSELENLYSDQKPMSGRELKKILKRNKLHFSHFDHKALAVGSIGQVHRGTIDKNQNVIVKILRPGSRSNIEKDLSTLKSLIVIWKTLKPSQKVHADLVEKSLSDMEEAFLKECDLANEAQSLLNFKKRFSYNQKIYIPKVYENYSTHEILTMEEIKGKSLKDLRSEVQGNSDEKKIVADLAFKEILSQIFEEGVFHADPHGGNLMLMEDGRLALIDLGLTGEFNSEHRKLLGRAMKAIVSKDINALFNALLSFGEIPEGFNQEQFKQDITQVVKENKKGMEDRMLGKSSKTSHTSNLEGFVQELFKVAHQHGIYIPQSVSLFIKSLVTIEGVARSLDPELNVVKSALPIILSSMSPDWLKARFWKKMFS